VCIHPSRNVYPKHLFTSHAFTRVCVCMCACKYIYPYVNVYVFDFSFSSSSPSVGLLVFICIHTKRYTFLYGQMYNKHTYLHITRIHTHCRCSSMYTCNVCLMYIYMYTHSLSHTCCRRSPVYTCNMYTFLYGHICIICICMYTHTHTHTHTHCTCSPVYTWNVYTFSYE